MVLNLVLENEYVPEWNNNKKDANPIVVVYKTPTVALYNQLVPKPKITMSIGGESVSTGTTEVVLDNSAIVQAMVTEIKNLDLKVNGVAVSIKTGRDLFGANVPAGLSGLIDEIGVHLQGLLVDKGVNAKN